MFRFDQPAGLMQPMANPVVSLGLLTLRPALAAETAAPRALCAPHDSVGARALPARILLLLAGRLYLAHHRSRRRHAGRLLQARTTGCHRHRMRPRFCPLAPLDSAAILAIPRRLPKYSDPRNLVPRPHLPHTRLTYHRTWETGLETEIRVADFSPAFFCPLKS
jgi:hypothetical protein